MIPFFVLHSTTSNIYKNTVQVLISKLLDLNIITDKKTKQGQESLFLTKDATAIPTKDNAVFISSKDEIKDATPVDSSYINLGVISIKKTLETSNRIRLRVIIIMLVWSYLIHFMMAILNISIMLTILYKEIGKSFESKIESHQTKIKLQQQEI